MTCSQRPRLPQHIVPQACWKLAGCDDMHFDVQQFLKIDLKPAEVEQRGAGQWVDQQTQGVALVIRPSITSRETRGLAT